MFSIILSVILVLILFVVTGFSLSRDQYGEPKLDGFKIRTRQLFAILGLIPIVMSCITFVPVNTVGIKFNQFTGVSNEVLQEGMKFKTPFDSVYIISTEVQTKAVTEVTGQTKDAQWIKISMDIKYRVSPTNAFEVFKQFKNLENVNNMLLSPLVQRAIESVTTKYNVIDILGEKRNSVYTEIESVVKEKLSESGIDFFSLVLVDTDAGAALESAIEQEAVAKKAVETASQVQAKAQVEAQTKVLQATAAAEVQIIEANAAAEVKTINAEAEAEANRKISASLTEQLLRSMEMEARKIHGWIEITGATPIIVK